MYLSSSIRTDIKLVSTGKPIYLPNTENLTFRQALVRQYKKEEKKKWITYHFISMGT